MQLYQLQYSYSNTTGPDENGNPGPVWYNKGDHTHSYTKALRVLVSEVIPTMSGPHMPETAFRIKFLENS